MESSGVYYSIGNKLVKMDDPENIGLPFAAILTSDEFDKISRLPGFDISSMPRYRNPHFCKAEVHDEMLSGTISFPEKKSHGKHGFSYYIANTGILFADDTGTAASIIEKMAATASWRTPSTGHFLYAFMEALIEKDLMSLEKIEDRLAKLESSVLANKIEGAMPVMVAVRKEILARSHYYAQLCDVALEFTENENGIFDDNSLMLLRHFADRANRLRLETQMLREYSLQVSEAYQTQIDIRQNTVMKVLTVVTSIFLPLSLVAGWYGMNFHNMPELGWRYGYVYVILLSAAIVIGCYWVFKREKLIK